jgi:hypothetical protein
MCRILSIASTLQDVHKHPIAERETFLLHENPGGWSHVPPVLRNSLRGAPMGRKVPPTWVEHLLTATAATAQQLTSNWGGR